MKRVAVTPKFTPMIGLVDGGMKKALAFWNFLLEALQSLGHINQSPRVTTNDATSCVVRE
jgi:hypothetical protein